MGALNFYVGFQKVASEPLENCNFCDPQGCSWISPYQNQNNLDCYIYVVEAKRVNPRVKQIDITVYFIQEQFGNGLFASKYDKYSVIPEHMCNKPCLGPMISQSTKWMTWLGSYTTSDT